MSRSLVTVDPLASGVRVSVDLSTIGLEHASLMPGMPANGSIVIEDGVIADTDGVRLMDIRFAPVADAGASGAQLQRMSAWNELLHAVAPHLDPVAINLALIHDVGSARLYHDVLDRRHLHQLAANVPLAADLLVHAERTKLLSRPESDELLSRPANEVTGTLLARFTSRTVWSDAHEELMSKLQLNPGECFQGSPSNKALMAWARNVRMSKPYGLVGLKLPDAPLRQIPQTILAAAVFMEAPNLDHVRAVTDPADWRLLHLLAASNPMLTYIALQAPKAAQRAVSEYYPEHIAGDYDRDFELVGAIARDMNDYLRRQLHLPAGQPSAQAALIRHSFARVARDSKAWHKALRDEAGHSEPPQETLETYARVVPLDGYAFRWKGEVYRVRQLRSAEALNAEGDAMNHCVGSYDEDCQAGDAHVFSIRRMAPSQPDGYESIATLSLTSSLGFDELRGPWNKKVDDGIRRCVLHILRKTEIALEGAEAAMTPERERGAYDKGAWRGKRMLASYRDLGGILRRFDQLAATDIPDGLEAQLVKLWRGSWGRASIGVWNLSDDELDAREDGRIHTEEDAITFASVWRMAEEIERSANAKFNEWLRADPRRGRYFDEIENLCGEIAGNDYILSQDQRYPIDLDLSGLSVAEEQLTIPARWRRGDALEGFGTADSTSALFGRTALAVVDNIAVLRAVNHHRTLLRLDTASTELQPPGLA